MSVAITTFSSARRFQLWHFSVSMQLLLLRSARSNEYATQIDVLIRGVEYIRIPTILNGLEIRLMDTIEPDIQAPHVARTSTHRVPWRIITEGDELGLVVGGNAFTVETTDNYDVTSPLLEDYSINLEVSLRGDSAEHIDDHEERR